MSGAAVDELDLNAVEAALAMLDGDPSPALATRASCCVSPVALKSVGDCFSCFDGEHNQGGATTCEDAAAATIDTSKPKRKRTRDPAADVLRRARRRQERQELRQQVERYEKQLQALAARGVTTKPNDPAEEPAAVDEDGRKVWEEVAREQRRQRVAGEEVNRQLKAKLAAHFDVSNRVGRLLTELASHHKNTKHSSANCGLLVRCCWGNHSAAVEDVISSSVPPHREQHVLEARELLREAYLTTDAVFATFMGFTGLGNGTELFSTSRIVQDESGPSVELLRSTLVPCGLQETMEIVWNWLKWKRRIMLHGFNYSCVTRQVTESGMEFQHHINFSGPFEAETFHGVSAMQKYEEADRMVLVFATKMVHAGGSIGFHDMGWILINRSPVDPLHKSVVRTCYRVMSDKDNCAETRIDALEFRSYVQRKLVQRMETRFKEISSELLRETGRHDLEALIDL